MKDGSQLNLHAQKSPTTVGDTSHPTVFAEGEESGGALARSIEAFAAAGDYATALRLIGENVLAAYFTMRPDALQRVLESAIAAGADDEGTARSILFLFPTKTGGRYHYQKPIESAFPDRLSDLSVMARITELRLQGLAHRSQALLDEMDARITGSATHFSHNSGWGIMLPLQSGITAMLTGDFKRALRYFTVAQSQPSLETFSFLTRDAYVKAATVHALFGNACDARTALVHASHIDRQPSWVEHLIDANVALVEAILSAEESSPAIEQLDAIPLQYLGEMLPFYVIAVQRVLTRAGRYRELLERTRMLEQLPVPRTDGEGLTGSIFPLIRVAVNLSRGDLDAARHHLNSADPDYVGSQYALALIENAAKRPQNAIREAHKLAAEQWSGLRRVELWRYSTLSSAFLQLGRHDELDEAIRAALADGITPAEASEFSRAVNEYAAAHIDGWPELAEEEPAAPHLPEPSSGLTSRELEVLILLRDDALTQQEVANELFLSLNTVKSHIKNIYRKLDATSRASAVLRAEAHGLL